jgi:hypothetical protein
MNYIPLLVGVCVVVALTPALPADPPKGGDVAFSADFEGQDGLKGWTEVGEGKMELAPGPSAGQSLMVDRPVELKPGSTHVRIAVPVEKIRGCRLACRALVKAQDVAKPPQPWNGVKFMLVTDSPGDRQYQQQNGVIGTFDWQTVGFLATVPKDATEAYLILGLEATTGRAWFDDVKLTVAAPPRPLPASLPATTQPVYKGHDLPRLRGVMIHHVPKEEDLRELAEKWNANVVRWQLHRPEVNYGTADGRDANAYDAWLAGCIKRLDELLPLCQKVGLKVVIDLHTPPGGQDEHKVMRLFQDAKYQRKFLEVWDTLVRRYRTSKAVWGYDILNEAVQGVPPEGVMDWQALATQAARNIRKLDPDHAIIIEPDQWGNPAALEFLDPIPVSGVVYSVHMYMPHQFTHQGVFGQPVGFRYPGEIAGRKWDKETLRAVLRPAIEYQRDYGVHVYVGEFSAIRWAPDHGAYNYLRDCIDLFEEYGWDWTYHAFREWSGWSVEHGDDPKDDAPSKTQTDREKLLRSWLTKNVRPKPQ